MKRHKYLRIYRKPWHLLFTVLTLVVPFILLLAFAEPAGFDTVSFVLDLLVSTVRVIIAFVISVLLALLLGLTLSRGRVGDFFLPVFDVLQSFPSFAMLPVAIIFFGKSNFTVILFLVLTMIWPILFAIISSLKLVKGEWEEAATMYGAKGWKRLIYFSLPISYPGLITGSIVGLGEGWEAVVGGEIIVALGSPGLGSFFGTNMAGKEVMFGVFGLLLFIFVMNKIIWLPLLEKSHKLLSE